MTNIYMRNMVCGLLTINLPMPLMQEHMHALDAICGKYDAMRFHTCHMQYKKEVDEKRNL